MNECLLQRLLEWDRWTSLRPPIFARQSAVRSCKLSNHLGILHDIVDRRSAYASFFECRWRFHQRHARQCAAIFAMESQWLCWQRGTARNARIHLTTVIRPFSGLCELPGPPVRRQLPDDGRGGIAPAIPFNSVCAGATVMESPVYAHGIEIFNRANTTKLSR